MTRFERLLYVLGALGMLSAVALGAFAAHGLRSRLSPEAIAVFKTGVDYHFYHALALLIVGQLVARMPRAQLLRWAGGLLAAGIPLFSGTLYALALTGARWWGFITPLGGTVWLIGWALVVVALWRQRAEQ